MMIGLVQPGTSRGTFLQMIGSRKMTPPRMLRMVPFGERYISCRLNSFTRASSGVMVAHLTATPTFLVASAASMVIWSLGLVALLHAEIEIHQVDIEIGMDQLVLDVLPDDPGHLVAVDFDDGVGDFDFRHFKEPPFESAAPAASCYSIASLAAKAASTLGPLHRPRAAASDGVTSETSARTPRQSAASAAFSVALGRIAADALAASGR